MHGDWYTVNNSEMDRVGDASLVTIWPATGGKPGTAYKRDIGPPCAIETTASGCGWRGDPNYRRHATLADARRRMAELGAYGVMRYVAAA